MQPGAGQTESLSGKLADVGVRPSPPPATTGKLPYANGLMEPARYQA